MGGSLNIFLIYFGLGMLFIKAMYSLLLDLLHPSGCEAERFLAETQQIASKVAHEIWEKPELALIQKVSRQKRLKKNAGV